MSYVKFHGLAFDLVGQRWELNRNTELQVTLTTFVVKLKFLLKFSYIMNYVT